MTDQSIATMTVRDLESLITKLIDERVNQSQALSINTVDRLQLVDKIYSLQTTIKERYGNFPDSTELLQQDRSTYCDLE
jgi:hypothetical protein